LDRELAISMIKPSIQDALVKCVFFLLLCISPITLKAELTAYTPAGVPASKDFRVWVNGQEIFAGQAGNSQHGFYSFATFDFTGNITVRVWSMRDIKWLDILPSAKKVGHKSIDDNTFEFDLSEPKMLTVLVNNDKNNALHLLTSLPQSSPPRTNDANVLYYKAGKAYDVGVLDLTNNQTLYIEGGAVLRGMVRVQGATNVSILGRGMIDGSNNRASGSGLNNEPWRLIYLDHADNVRVEGITLFNSLHWTFHNFACKALKINNIRILNWNYGSDGIDSCSCQDEVISDCFIRSNDDCLVFKALDFFHPSYYPNPRADKPNVKNVLVERCTLWNMDYGNVFEIGFEEQCEKVSDLTFRDCDVLMQDERGAIFSIHNGDYATVENILWDNIRVENADLCANSKLFDLAIIYSMWGYDKNPFPETVRAKPKPNGAWDNLLSELPDKKEFYASNRGYIKNITFQNIQILDGKFPYSVINGYDDNHLVENVAFENITVQGRKVSGGKADLKLFTKFAENIQFK